jgi:hypothetical protein
MPLEHFFYVSRAREAVTDRDIDDILATSRSRNALVGLTGKLLYTGEHFAQVLEGSHDALDPVIESIAQDGRHSRMRRLVRAPLDVRRFPEWTMAYVERVGAADLVDQLMNSPDVSPDRARRIIDGLFGHG